MLDVETAKIIQMNCITLGKNIHDVKKKYSELHQTSPEFKLLAFLFRVPRSKLILEGNLLYIFIYIPNHSGQPHNINCGVQ